MANSQFPECFLWGAATSAHQVEGNTNNNWTKWEVEHADHFAKIAKERFGGFAVWNDIEKEARDPNNYISGRACDHYNRFEEDFDIAKSLSHNAHRFSIEWSRIEPEEGKFDEKEIEHYRNVIKALKQRGLEPFVTLWHWTDPVWIGEMGAWKNKKTVEYFLRYAKRVFTEYKDLVTFWMPLNEPSTEISYGYLFGRQPSGYKSWFVANSAFKNLMKVQKEIYTIAKSVSKDFQIGCSHFMFNRVPYKNLPWNIIACRVLNYFSDKRFFDFFKNSCDFFGLQYYQPFFVNFRLGGSFFGFVENKEDGIWKNDLEWEIMPEGFYHVIKRASVIGKPIYITENGLADAKDIHRPKFIKEHLKYLQKAISEGVDVRGYFHWSLLDNFEFVDLRGYWPRFGLVEIDYKTLERRIRPSAYVYKEIIENGIQ